MTYLNRTHNFFPVDIPRRCKGGTGLCHPNELCYYYNKQSGQCEQFQWVGWYGIGNNRFTTLEGCQRTCEGVIHFWLKLVRCFKN